jgi:hypothetical protein
MFMFAIKSMCLCGKKMFPPPIAMPLNKKRARMRLFFNGVFSLRL